MSVAISPFSLSEGISLYLFLPPLAGGSARVPCQITDLAGWVREGDFQGKSVFEGIHPHPNPLPSREREKIESPFFFSPSPGGRDKGRGKFFGKEIFEGFIRGNSFPLILENLFFPVISCFYIFYFCLYVFVFWG